VSTSEGASAQGRSDRAEAAAIVIIVDDSGRVAAMDGAAEELFGWPAGEAVGRQLREVLPTTGGESIVHLDGPMTSAVQRLRAVALRHRDGHEITANVTISQLAGGDKSMFVLLVEPVAFGEADFARRVEQWLKALVYRASDVAFVVDAEGTIRFVSAVANPPLGYKPSDTVGQSAFAFVHPDDRERAERLLARVLSSDDLQEPVQLRGLASDGSFRHVELALTNMLDNPLIAGLVVNMRDVTDRLSMEDALRASEARYRGIVETAQEGIWLVGMAGDTLFANRSLAGILGRELDDINRLNIFEVIDESATADARVRLQSRREVGHEVYEIPFTRGDGEHRHASVSASPLFVNEEYLGSLLMISDITERKRNESELERLALYDELTGLPNRTLLHDRLAQAMRQRSPARSIGVFFIDLDDFKAVNDSYGHQAGDELLRIVAQRLSMVAREGDTLARFAGDEFVMICPDVDNEIEANALAERILEVLTPPVKIGSALVTMNASIGVALQQSPRDGEQLLRDADVAMFQAKKRGRGRHVMFDPRVARQSRYHLEDVRRLRTAIDDGEMEVYFQPQVQLEDGSICSVEALARWRHPRRGLLEPRDFIGLAEASGLIVELGRFVLYAACRQAAEWAETLSEPLPIAVNVSARQLDDENLPTTVSEALDASHLAPGLLGLEITETAVMNDPGRAQRVLTELHDQGVRLAIDDFGTGYSSLTHLKRLPVDEIKIDRGFIDGVDRLGDDRSIVGAVVNMAKALDLRVVGEGVETREQAQALQEMGCSVAQGFLYGRPVEAAEITESLLADEAQEERKPRC